MFLHYYSYNFHLKSKLMHINQTDACPPASSCAHSNWDVEKALYFKIFYCKKGYCTEVRPK